LEEGTFSDVKTVPFINSNFIPVKVKTSLNETYHTPSGDLTTGELVRRFQIRGVPSTFFLNKDGQPVFNVPGYVPADIYENVLRYISEEHFKNQSFDDYQESLGM